MSTSSGPAVALSGLRGNDYARDAHYDCRHHRASLLTHFAAGVDSIKAAKWRKRESLQSFSHANKSATRARRRSKRLLRSPQTQEVAVALRASERAPRPRSARQTKPAGPNGIVRAGLARTYRGQSTDPARKQLAVRAYLVTTSLVVRQCERCLCAPTKMAPGRDSEARAGGHSSCTKWRAATKRVGTSLFASSSPLNMDKFPPNSPSNARSPSAARARATATVRARASERASCSEKLLSNEPLSDGR